MLLHKDPCFTIFFGDTRHQFIPADLKQQPELLEEYSSFTAVRKAMALKELVFLHQTHSAKGLCIESSEQAHLYKPFTFDGDYLVTQQSHVGLAVATADCLPIVIYDTFHHVVGVVHAGWKGTVKKIMPAVVQHMMKHHGSRLESLKFYFGPAAKPCCYEIKEDVIELLEAFSYADQVVSEVQGKYYLDKALLNSLQLQELGIKKEQINCRYNVCTMCDPSFCSHRRSKGKPERQFTVVSLR